MSKESFGGRTSVWNNEQTMLRSLFLRAPKATRGPRCSTGGSRRHHEPAHAGNEGFDVITKGVGQFGGNVTIGRDLVLDFLVQLAQPRPVHARTIVVRGVITEIAGRDVVDLVNDVVARDEVRIAALARVMDVRRVHRSEKGNQHRNDEHEDRGKRTQIGQTRDERDDEERRQNERALMRGISMTDFVRPRIRLKRVPHGVFEPAHRGAIIVLPARLVFVLVEIIHVMTKRMVQNPSVCRDARLQRIHLFEQTIEDRGFERRHVLVMMVERANTPLREDADQCVRHERPYVVHERVNQDIAAEDQGKAEDGNSILLISKDTHECLDRGIREEGI